MWDKINRYNDINWFECMVAVVFVLVCRYWKLAVGGIIIAIIAWRCDWIYGI